MNKRRWYVLYLRSRYEKKVHDELERRGIESFLPTVVETRQWSDRKKKVRVPLFPGYHFVKIELTQKLRVLEVVGVVRIVSIRGRPSPVPDEQIESLKLIIASPRTIRRENPLSGGELVKVKSGPFAGAQGIVVRTKNSTRVVVSLESIQQAVSVEVDAAALELAQPQAKAVMDEGSSIEK